MTYSPLSPGNNLGIQTRQHIYTKRLIRNFATNRRVWVAELPSWKVEDKSAEWRGSKVWRRWNNSAERVASGYERELHKKVDRCQRDNIFRGHRAANEYYAVWYVKSRLMRTELEDLVLNQGILGDDLVSSELEILESKGCVAIPNVNGKATFRGIDQTHLAMLFQVQHLLRGMENVRWQLVIASDDSFVAPMSAPNKLLIPLSHNRLLCGFDKSQRHKPHFDTDFEDVDNLNYELVRSEENWVVGSSKERLKRVCEVCIERGK